MAPTSRPLVAPPSGSSRASRSTGCARVYASLARPVDRWSGSDLLRSGAIGHAVHPLLTDLPLGFWTAATALDLRGRRQDRAASQWLVGAGLAAWPHRADRAGRAGPRDRAETQRVGALHGVAQRASRARCTSPRSWRARGATHTLGVVAALAGAAVTGASGYLGGHLTTARKVGSRDAASPTTRWARGPAISRYPDRPDRRPAHSRDRRRARRLRARRPRRGPPRRARR